MKQIPGPATATHSAQQENSLVTGEKLRNQEKSK